MTVSLGLVATVGGYIWVTMNTTRVIEAFQSGDLAGVLSSGTGVPLANIGISFPMIWGHNLRAVAVILLLGLFSFGVLGTLIFLLNTGVIGAVVGLEGALGTSPLKLVAFGILPHGIFEIPALILSSAAVLYIGIALVTPRSQRTLGEVLIETIADWTKIGIGLVLPLLTIAAVVETWVTPVLLMSMLK
jgi:stage II sporulation protein M